MTADGGAEAASGPLASLRADPEWDDLMGCGSPAIFLRKEPPQQQQLGDAGPLPEFETEVTFHVCGRVLSAGNGDGSGSSGAGAVFLDTRAGVGVGGGGADEGAGDHAGTAAAGPLCVHIGEEDHPLVTPGLGLGLKRLRAGESATVRVDARFGYGVSGWPPVVGAGAALEYSVSMLRVGGGGGGAEAGTAGEGGEAEAEAEALRAAMARKEWGNGWFRQRRMERAIRCYRTGLHLLGPPESAPPLAEAAGGGADSGGGGGGAAHRGFRAYHARRAHVALGVALGNNLAKAEEKRGEVSKAMEALAEVLRRDPDNVKALCAGCRLAIAAHELEGAAAALGEPASASQRAGHRSSSRPCRDMPCRSHSHPT
jgi:hypothetical protein